MNEQRKTFSVAKSEQQTKKVMCHYVEQPSGKVMYHYVEQPSGKVMCHYVKQPPVKATPKCEIKHQNPKTMVKIVRENVASPNEILTCIKNHGLTEKGGFEKHTIINTTPESNVKTNNNMPIAVSFASSPQKKPFDTFSYANNMPPEFMYQEDGFIVSKDGRLLFKGAEVMNCAVCIDRTTKSDKRLEYACRVYINGMIFEEKVPSKDFTNIIWLQKKIPGFSTKGEKNWAYQTIYKYLNNIAGNLGGRNITAEIRKPGWTKFNENCVYLTPDGSIPPLERRIISKSGQHFGNLENEPLGNINSFLKMAKLTYELWQAPVISIYTIMSFSYKLFKDAGMLPKFVLFVHGPRGSYKTSISLVLTQIERTESPRFNLKSKSAGLETGYKEYKDAVMLIDDLAPTEELYERKIMQSNLEMVVRAFGDGTGKKRNYDFQPEEYELDQYEAEGGAVITGEYTTGCESSLARCLFIPLLRKDVDVKLLTELQEDKKLLPAFLVGYINFLSCKYSEIVEFIKSRGKYYRNKFLNLFSNVRYSEYYAQLTVTVEILFMKYGYETGQLSREAAEKHVTYFNNYIFQAIQYNNKSLIESSPITLLCKAIVVKLNECMYPIVAKGSEPDDMKHYVLESDSSYYIRQTDILAMKNAYDNDNGITQPGVTSTFLAQLLCDYGISIPVYEGNSKRYGRKIGKARYMEIKKQKLSEIANLEI